MDLCVAGATWWSAAVLERSGGKQTSCPMSCLRKRKWHVTYHYRCPPSWRWLSRRLFTSKTIGKLSYLKSKNCWTFVLKFSAGIRYHNGSTGSGRHPTGVAAITRKGRLVLGGLFRSHVRQEDHRQSRSRSDGVPGHSRSGGYRRQRLFAALCPVPKKAFGNPGTTRGERTSFHSDSRTLGARILGRSLPRSDGTDWSPLDGLVSIELFRPKVR